MPKWIRLCATQDLPRTGDLKEIEADGRTICLANVNGRLSAVSSICPHAGASLAQGWLDGSSVVCPAHCWTFDLCTGIAAEPEDARIAVFPLLIKGEEVLVDFA